MNPPARTLILLASTVALAAPCAASSHPRAASTRPGVPEVAYFTALLERAETAPIEDFLHLWFPRDTKAVERSYLDSCVDAAHSTMILAANGAIAPECRPDVLYSWGPIEKAIQIKSELKDDQDWNKPVNGGKTIWATISPVSTFSYGPVQIRFKFRPGTNFPHGLTTDEPGIVENTGGLMDFLFDNANVVESWSFGTPEQYDEIVKDIRRYMTSPNVVTYSGNGFATPGLDNLWRGGVSEREAQAEPVLRERLTTLIKLILAGKGEVHYGKGVPHSVELHFATLQPTYFNEQ